MFLKLKIKIKDLKFLKSKYKAALSALSEVSCREFRKELSL